MLDEFSKLVEIKGLEKFWLIFKSQIKSSKFSDILTMENEGAIFSFKKYRILEFIPSTNFNVIIDTNERDMYIATIEGFDLIAHSDTLKGALNALAEELIEYALEYINEAPIYFMAPNRRKHFGYILFVLLHENIEEVISTFNYQMLKLD